MTHSHSETDHEQEHETRQRKSTSSPKKMNGYTSHPPPTIRTNSNSSSSSSPSSSSPASPSSPSSPPRAHPIPTDPSTWPEGHTDKGETFRIPPTLNTINMFHPKNLSLPGIVTVTLAATSLSLILFGNFPKWFHILIFLFFRVCYNVGLGAILSTQSLHRSFTHFYEHVMSDRQSWRARLFAHLAMCTLPYELRRTYTIDSFPTAFNAWLVYKNLVNLILFNDSFNYLFLGIKCFHWPEEITVLVIAQYAVGIFLCVFNYWAKLDAHRCIGEYCWYWGDFFYRKDENLTFDGIFELFPHPMYTVGYALYYGYSLICRSYTMLFVSITAHLAQLAFLVIVEEPHIERTYGSPQTLDKSQMRVLYDPREGLFPTKDSIFFFHLDLTNSGDVANVLLCVYTAVVCVTVTDPFWTILQVVVWRVLHWLGMGIILWNQSRRQWWTRRYIERGRTLYEAFSHWKKLYNMSLTVNVVAFVGCAIRHFELSWADLFSGYRMAMIVIGVLLILLSIWSVNSTYQVVGDFGWFYGDFFVSENTYQQQVCYTGIYRFLNNPDCVTGYAGLYGLSLITQSYALFGLALLAQSLNIAFLNIVEIPHMQKLYDNKIRVENPHYRAIKKFLPGMPEPIRQSELKLKQQARTIRLKAMTEVYQLYKKIAEERKSRRGSQSRGSEIIIRAPESHTLGTPLTIEFETNENHSDTDWIGIYPVGVPSVPGVSEGKWMYVTPGATGTLTFSSSLLPTSEGVYELRYHRSNQYKIQAKIPIMLESPPMTEDQMMNDDEDMGSPMTSPKTSAANTPSKWSKETKKTH